jgi:hypothetical protein
VGQALQKAGGPGVVKLDGLTRVWDELELGRKEKNGFLGCRFGFKHFLTNFLN